MKARFWPAATVSDPHPPPTGMQINRSTRLIRAPINPGGLSDEFRILGQMQLIDDGTAHIIRFQKLHFSLHHRGVDIDCAARPQSAD